MKYRDATPEQIQRAIDGFKSRQVRVVKRVRRPTNRRKGLGTIIATVLSRIGIRKKPGCGCGRRERQLNEWGWRMMDRLRKLCAWLRGSR